uniref:tRNA pseudouridine synthase 1 n=1 Tax=Lygus hesperus TaxID=30085 RepID=A0A0A9YAF3_LYGHE
MVDTESKQRKIKFALLVGYNGSGYRGLQINGEERTLEKELKDAIFRAGFISRDNQVDLHKIGWSRAARTDKGVHAAGNIIAAKFQVSPSELCDNFVNIVRCVNAQLPPQIRVLHLTRVTGSFDAKHFASSRTYEYVIPSFAFATLAEYPSGLEQAMLERWNECVDGALEVCELPRQ